MIDDSFLPQELIINKKWLLAIRILTGIYLLLIVFVIISATNGWFQDLFDWVQERSTDKFMHFILIGLLSLLVNLSLNCRMVRVGGIGVQVGTLGLMALFSLEEFSQRFFENRTFDWWDLACNLGGIIVFSWIAWLIHTRLRPANAT